MLYPTRDVGGFGRYCISMAFLVIPEVCVLLSLLVTCLQSGFCVLTDCMPFLYALRMAVYLTQNRSRSVTLIAWNTISSKVSRDLSVTGQYPS